MSAFGFTKLAINLVSGLGVTKIVTDVIQNNTNVVTTFDAIRVNAGILALGTVVLDHTSNHINARLDELAAWQAKRKTEIKKKEEEASKP